MYMDKLWTAVSARGGLRRMRAFILEANFSSKAGGSLLRQQREQRGDEGGGKPDTSVTACTRHSHAWGLPALWDWKHVGQHRRG